MTHLINNIYAVAVPDGSKHWSKLQSSKDSITAKLFELNGNQLINFCGDKGIVFNYQLPEGRWEIIGLAHEVTEEAAAEIVSDDYGKLPDFEHEGMIYSIAKDSLYSLLHSKRLTRNVLLLKKID